MKCEFDWNNIKERLRESETNQKTGLSINPGDQMRKHVYTIEDERERKINPNYTVKKKKKNPFAILWIALI